MVTLANPAPLAASNSENNVAVKQINTNDYELQRIQRHFQEAVTLLSQNITKSIAALSTTSAALPYTVDPAKSPVPLSFSRVVRDSLQIFNAGSSTFTAPQAGIYLLSFQGIFSVPAGPTNVKVFANSSISGVLAAFTAPVAASIAQAIFSVLVSLKSNENINFSVNGDAPGTITLNAQATVGLCWEG